MVAMIEMFSDSEYSAFGIGCLAFVLATFVLYIVVTQMVNLEKWRYKRLKKEERKKKEMSMYVDKENFNKAAYNALDEGRMTAFMTEGDNYFFIYKEDNE